LSENLKTVALLLFWAIDKNPSRR